MTQKFNPNKKLERIIYSFKEYHDHCLNEDVPIPKKVLDGAIQLLLEIQEEIQFLDISNRRRGIALQTLEENALKKIDQLQKELEK